MNRNTALSGIIVCVLLLTLGLGCNPGSSSKGDRGRIQVGTKSVHVQYLANNEERLKGLRRFPLLGEGEGALFVYPQAMPDLYWSNRNVLKQELSVAFVGSNRSILRIRQMKADTGRVVNAGEPAQFILVVNGGWFEGNQVSVGDHLTVSDEVVERAETVYSIQETRSIHVKGKHVTVEVADTPDLRRSGLMHRKALPEHQGMIFLYETPGRRSFHMKNTLVPLDIAFLNADGTIAEVKQMAPLDRSSTRSSGKVMHVLELRKGWFQDHGVTPGDQFDLTALDEFRPRTEVQEK
jgi:uncharacterized membrane protein (UPF0127 family)